MVCLNTVSAEKSEYGGAVKKTSHPGFEIKVEFDESKKKKSFTCPCCGKDVGYKAFRYEFNLRKALKWPVILTGIGPILFLIGVFLIMGGWSAERAVMYVGIWGVAAFASGLVLLLIQSMRYAFFYRKDKGRYIFSLSGLSPGHVLLNWTTRGRWKTLSPVLP